MTLLASKVVVFLLLVLCCSPSLAFKVTILADTNRDGKVDLVGSSDSIDKTNWTEASGALFLAAISDTDRRCSSLIKKSTPDEELDMCHDASDDVLRTPAYLAPLRTVPIPGLGRSAYGSIAVLEDLAILKVRLFHKTATGWHFLKPGFKFSASDLKAGLHLGIDGRDIRRPDGWDGRATIKFTVRDGKRETSDQVALRVAPVLTHHHLQAVQQVLSSWATGLSGPQDKFVEDLQKLSRKAGIEKPVFLFNETRFRHYLDHWTQDFFESGYTSIPGPDGPVVLHVMIRSCQTWRDAGRQIYKYLRSEKVGAVQLIAEGGDPDSLGNLETIPPYRHKGRNYRAGRAIMGSREDRKPEMLKFLRAQEEQAPVEVDVDWLSVGHADEFIQFLPYDSQRGWVLMVPDPLAGLALLEKARDEGHGNIASISRPRFPTDPRSRSKVKTISEALRMKNFATIQDACAKRVKANIEILKRETGLKDDEIIGIPQIFYDHVRALESSPSLGQYSWQPPPLDTRTDSETAEKSTPPSRHRREPWKPLSLLVAGEPGGKPRRSFPNQLKVTSLFPNSVNGIVLGNQQYVAPNPWGPVINGKDIVAAAISSAYSKANFTVNFMDDWFSHHIESGDVHCGSNTIRDPNAPWW